MTTSGAAGTATRSSARPPLSAGGRLLVAAIVLAAVNLRPAVASVGPVLEEIRADLGLSAAAAAVLTALPVLCFGAGGFLAPRLARRVGTEATLTAVCAATAAGILLRLGPSPFTLFAGTFLAGSAIAVANVLIPALVKREFPHRAGLVMGLYVSVTVGGAAVAAAVSVPVTEALGGWRAGLGVWAVPAVLALALWLVVTVTRRRRRAPSDRTTTTPRSVLRDPVAWHLTAYMGLQSLPFYALLSWLPTVYRDYGVSPQTAGRLLSFMVVLGVPTALLLPSVVTRARRQSGWAIGTSSLVAAGFVGLLVAPTAVPWLWTTLFGIGLGASFPLALTLVVLRTRDATDAASVSGLSQSVGYLVAAAGPFLFGLLHDASGGWTVPVVFLLVLLVPQALAGAAAGRAVHVHDAAGG